MTAYFRYMGERPAAPAAALAVHLCVLLTTGGLAGQAVREEVVSIDFTGNRALSDAELRRAVLTHPSSCPPLLAVTCALGIDWGRNRAYLSRRTLDADAENLRILYHAHGFRAVDVESEVMSRDDGTVAVSFRIREGAPYRVGEIDLTGDSVPPELGLADALPFGVGDPLSPLLLLETTDTLTLRLRNAGYAWAEVFDGFRRATAGATRPR